MRKTVVLYGISLALLATLLEFIQYRYLTRAYPTELLLGLVAAVFLALGIWAGRRTVSRRAPSAFVRNDAAVRELAISEREYDVLLLLARGLSNQEISDELHISLNTTKTHLSRLFQKIDAPRRTKVVQKARFLKLVP